MRRLTSKALIAVIAATVLLFAAASLAGAGLVAHGDLFVSFEGGISPTALPRHTLAPISIVLSAEVRTPPGKEPPPLRQIQLAINRNGVLDTKGLPICRLSQLEGTTPIQALGVCRDARVGTGTFAARASFPEQATFPARGHILAFNGISEGRPVVFAHVYGADPDPSTAVITFYIRHSGKGPYGVVLNALMPPALAGYGYVKHIALSLHRTFPYRGRERSYLSATCATPAGVPIADFPFARASMRFEGGAVLSSSMVRTCRARG